MLTGLPIGYSVIVALTGLPIGYSVVVALTGLPIGYSVIVAIIGLPIGYSVIVALTGLAIGYSVTVAIIGHPIRCNGKLRQFLQSGTMNTSRTSTIFSSFKEPTQFHLFMKLEALVLAVRQETDLLFSIYDAKSNEVIRQVDQL